MGRTGLMCSLMNNHQEMVCCAAHVQVCSFVRLETVQVRHQPLKSKSMVKMIYLVVSFLQQVNNMHHFLFSIFTFAIGPIMG
jgi:hypothetical protein